MVRQEPAHAAEPIVHATDIGFALVNLLLHDGCLLDAVAEVHGKLLRQFADPMQDSQQVGRCHHPQSRHSIALYHQGLSHHVDAGLNISRRPDGPAAAFKLVLLQQADIHRVRIVIGAWLQGKAAKAAGYSLQFPACSLHHPRNLQCAAAPHSCVRRTSQNLCTKSEGVFKRLIGHKNCTDILYNNINRGLGMSIVHRDAEVTGLGFGYLCSWQRLRPRPFYRPFAPHSSVCLPFFVLAGCPVPMAELLRESEYRPGLRCMRQKRCLCGSHFEQWPCSGCSPPAWFLSCGCCAWLAGSCPGVPAAAKALALALALSAGTGSTCAIFIQGVIKMRLIVFVLLAALTGRHSAADDAAAAAAAAKGGTGSPQPLQVDKPTPLMVAAAQGDLDKLSQLLSMASHSPQLRPRIGACDAAQRTALHYALEGRHHNVLQQLQGLQGQHEQVVQRLSQLPADLLDSSFNCPLYYAVQLRNLPATATLLQAGPVHDRWRCLTTRDHYGHVALHGAVVSRSSGLARVFSRIQQLGQAPAADFAQYLGLDARVIDTMVSQQDKAHSISHTAMESAALWRDLEMVLDTMESLQRTVSQTAADATTQHTDSESQGFDPFSTPPVDWPTADGNAPLALAASTGRQRAVLEFLVRRGAEVNRANPLGRAALHLAATAGFHDQVQYLLEAGADCRATDRWGRTARDLAQLAGHTRVLRVLGQACPLVEAAMAAETATGNSAFSRFSSDLSPGSARGEGTCDFDVVEAGTTLSTTDFYRDYVSLQRPLLIKGGFTGQINWELLSQPQFDNVSVAVARVPYAHLYGGAAPVQQKLSTFIQQSVLSATTQQSADTLEESAVPAYVFDGMVLARHPHLQELIPPPLHLTGRQILLRQLMVGPAGSGAAPHFHGHAVNLLARGRKRWALFAPTDAFFYFGPAQQWWSQASDSQQNFDMNGGSNASGQPHYRQCVQEAGDIVYVPSQWGHAVLNEEAVIAAAYEFVPETLLE